MSRAAEFPSQGTCFGYEIRSDLSFRYTRSGRGEPLEIVEARLPGDAGEVLRTWSPPLFPNRVRLHASGQAYRLWIEDGGWFGIDPSGPRIVVPPDVDPVRREERVWGLPTLLCFLARGDVPLHAAAVELDGRAVLLGAPSGFGKTTLAAGFTSAGYRILSEDLVCLRSGRTPSVLPGPAMLRMRRDVADAVEVDGATEVGRDDDRVHLSLTRDRGDCEPVPLSAIVMLGANDTTPAVEPVEEAEAVRDLWALSFNLPTDEDRKRCFHAVARLAASVPTWRLTRRMEVGDLGPTVERLTRALS